MKKFLVLMCVLSLFLAGNVFAASITETGMSQGDLVILLKSLKAGVLNGAVSSGGLTSGFTALQGATAKTVYPMPFKINGILYSLSSTSNMYLTKTAVQAVSTYCYYLFTINSSGAVTVTKGKEAASTSASSYPAAPSGGVIFGGVLVKTSAATAFTMGTSSFSTSYLPYSPIWYNLSAIANERGLAVLP
jgi:hypothetical protein